MKARDGHLAWSNLKSALVEFTATVDACDTIGLREALMQAVPEFRSHDQPEDWLYSKREGAAKPAFG
jgi:hypothetical protein